MRRVQMNHRFRRDRKGNVHVDTLFGGDRWQHHVHSEAAFACWFELIAGAELISLPDDECACDLVVGQVLEHDGQIWNHPQFAQ
jgi:hypothetical protein